ncbi:hypothetical protein PpBr36_02462, partial [Pyricularia pennisetigena]|uniref:hypothetical protein n=1 Tax=Pyricularia pennisetigena TaxID=1578925 RepID=UPI0011542AB0
HIMTAIIPASWREILLYLLLGVIVIFACNAIYNVFFHPLHNFPGPKSHAISRIPYTYHWMRGDLVRHVAALHRVHGDIVRLAPGELSFGDPRAWQDIMGGGSRDLQKWDGLYGVPRFLPTHIQNTTDKARHRMLRRAMRPGFSDAALRAQEHVVASHVDRFIQKLRDRRGAVVDLELWYRFIVFDVIGDLVFGESFGCAKSSEFHPWIRDICDTGAMMSYLMAANMYPIVRDVVNFLIDGLAKSGFAAQKKTLVPILERRLRSKTQRLDLVNPLIENMEEWKWTIDDLIPHAIVFVGAGSETTAGVLGAVTAFLLENPEAMARAKEEVRSAFLSDSDINLERVESRLPFLRACTDEALRLYPQSGCASLRITGDNDIICGVPIPPKTVVGIWPYAVYRDPKLWRKPDEFHPERWLGDPEYANDVREAFNPFHVGSRDCIGRGLAIMELRLVMARMIYNFDMRLVGAGMKDDPRTWVDRQKNFFIVWKRVPLEVVLTPTKS